MATQWISGAISNYVTNAVSGTVATAGGFAGSAVNSVGSTINGVGQSIDRTISHYGNTTKDYGNAIKDWTKAPGVREGTAMNPLGLSDIPSGGKRAIMGPKPPRPQPTTTKSSPSIVPANKALTMGKGMAGSAVSGATSKVGSTAGRLGNAKPQASLPSSKPVGYKVPGGSKPTPAVKSSPAKAPASKGLTSGKTTISAESRPPRKKK